MRNTSPSANYGQSSTLQADASPSIKTVLLRFGVSGLPAGATITSATLRLFVVDPSSQAGQVRAVSGQWSESTITWSNAPVIGSGIAKMSSPAVRGTWARADVTSAVSENGDVNFYVVTASADGVDYSSSEASSNRPALDVQWAAAATGSPSVTPAPTVVSTPSPTPLPTAVPSASPTPVPIVTSGSTAGAARIWKNASSGFDQYTSDSTYADTINTRYKGMLVYEPYFDSRLSWYQGTALFYKDAYAIYTDAARNKDGASTGWILRDAAGNPCYIPYGSPYDQYAADIGNQAFRNNWISYATAKLGGFPGYEGVFIDDVNLDLTRVSCGSSSGQGNNNSPIDPRTGQVMTNDNWKRYFAEFMEQVRSATPGKIIAHNTIWYVTAFDDAYLAREIQSADIIQMEQGFADRGLTGGTGKYSWSRKMAFVDTVHSLGKTVIDRDEAVASAGEEEYGLANYFLLNGDRDFYDPVYLSNPPDSWNVYGLDLGAPVGSRYLWNNLWRRDFSGGFVLVSPPGSLATTTSLGATYTDVYGNQYSSVSLSGRQGKIFVSAAR